PAGAPDLHAIRHAADAGGRRLQRLAQHAGPAALRGARLRGGDGPGADVPLVPGVLPGAVAGQGLSPRRGTHRRGDDRAAHAAAQAAPRAADNDKAARWAAGAVYALTCGGPIWDVADHVALDAAAAARAAGRAVAQLALVRCVYGKPFRPVTFDRGWVTPEVA